MKLTLHQFDLPLRHVFRISREAISTQRTMIVELQAEGHSGFGEATTNHYYGFTYENMAAALEAVRSQIEAAPLDDPATFWRTMHPLLADNPFAQCALDQAAHDLWGKLLGKPVYTLWGLEAKNMPVTNYTIGIDEIDVMVAKMAEFPNWPVYKIKLGTEHDLDIVRALREHTKAAFRVDANCGWDVEETIRNSYALKEMNVEFIEQPLAADRWEDMRQVYANSALPIIADESCIVPADVDRCADHFHGINIKLVKCGGLTPAREMISRARELNMRVMVGCMTESTVGISAIAQLLPLLDYVDMDGALLLANDIATGVTIDQGVCHYAAENGCGVRLLGDMHDSAAGARTVSGSSSADAQAAQAAQAKRRQTQDLIQMIKDYADKLGHDGTTRGDLKILSRTLRELRYAFKVFSPYRRRRKVTIFGSARTAETAPSYQQAVELGRAMADEDWLVITGAASGIMEAGHRGSGREHAMGLNIMLPFEQESNPIIAGDEKLVHMKYFFTRKLMFVKECDAVACLPGGFGTLDEALEVLTLMQTGKQNVIPVVLLDAKDGTFWQTFQQFIVEQLLQDGMISAEDLHLYKITDSHEAAVQEITHFYSNYHSMRYVKGKLVLRIHRPLSADRLRTANSQFSDILTGGEIEQSAPLEAEQDEVHLAHNPRLVLKFNRRNHGRLRQLIDFINQPETN